MAVRVPKKYVIRRADQRRALGSAIRIEIIGTFTALKGLSIREVAERMGRRPGSLYYHFRLLEEVGLLRRVGERPAGKKIEALYAPVARRFEMEAPGDPGEAADSALKTMSSAFRMAERDMKSALEEGGARADGDDRNFTAFRMHMRLTKESLAELNQHLEALQDFVSRENGRTEVPEDADQYCSLTLALLPLRGRSGE